MKDELEKEPEYKNLLDNFIRLLLNNKIESNSNLIFEIPLRSKTIDLNVFAVNKAFINQYTPVDVK